jgi:Protein of unknown function (DUF2793)
MPEGETSVRFDLPLLMAGQAQKEVTHNEALTLIDLALCPVVEAVGLNSPPAGPVSGQAWIVGSAPSEAWLGEADALAGWTAGGWRFVRLPVGASVTMRTNGLKCIRKLTGWEVSPTMVTPTGGAIVDAECRTALSVLIAVLISHGLVASS